MWGGSGADRFRFSAVPDSRASDFIFDFSSTEGDQFHLLAAVFADLGSLGSLAEDRFMLGPVATHPNHRILYVSSQGQLLYDPDGDASLAPVPFAHVPQGLSLSSSQFLVV
jgi:Ca2+-binding RTX toxin-like protein